MFNLKLMRVLWPAFLAACVLELLVFAVLDPQDLHLFSRPLPLSRQGVYTLGFFVFWAVCAVSNSITVLLAMSAAEINACPYPASNRPEGCQR